MSIDSPTDEIRYGMTANVSVSDESSAKGAVLPITAIYQTDNKPGCG